MKDSWIHHSNTIQHIEHIHHPQEHRYADASTFAIETLYDLDHRLKGFLGNSKFIWTAKIDDKISAKIAKVNGTVGVGYKTKSARFHYDDKGLDTAYADKPYMRDALKHLLKYGKSLFESNTYFDNVEDNVLYQVGLVHSGNSDVICKLHNGTWCKPNVLCYTFRDPQSAQLGINIVSRSDIDPKTYEAINIHQNISDRILWDKGPDLHIINNRLDFSACPSYYSGTDQMKVAMLLESIRVLHAECLRYDTYYEIEGHEKYMKRFLNNLIRKKISRFYNVETYVKFLTDLSEKEVAKLKTEAGQKRKAELFRTLIMDVEDFPDSFNRIMNMQTAIRQARDIMLEISRHAHFKDMYVSRSEKSATSDMIPPEGLVVSTQLDDGTMACLKYVPHEITEALLDNTERFSGQ